MWPAHNEQFSTFQTTMSEGDREVLHITDVKAIQQKINSVPRKKAKHSTAEDKVLAGQAAIKNGNVVEALGQTPPSLTWQPSTRRWLSPP